VGRGASLKFVGETYCDGVMDGEVVSVGGLKVPRKTPLFAVSRHRHNIDYSTKK
jgi:hypothetical protein